jgi:hypothetical protein
MKGLVYLLGISAIVANATDLLSTLLGLTLGSQELNPLYYTLGPVGFFLMKIILPMLTIVSAMVLCHYVPQLKVGCSILLGVVTLVFALATINNLVVLCLS